MRYYLIAGERSGDLHGGNLLKSLFKLDADAVCKGFGGDDMQRAGMDITVHYRQLAFMGFLEVIKNIFTIKRLLKQCKEDILDFRPDAIILIDYAGFNLKIAAFAKAQGIPVCYYISPKVWAWNQKRAVKIKKQVDLMLVILPFEKDFYRKYGWEVQYVGNPVLDAIKDAQNEQVKPPLNKAIPTGNQGVIAILPGSRHQELQYVLPELEKLVIRFPEEQFAVAAVDNLQDELYAGISHHDNVILVYAHTYALLSQAKAAIVTSGTATLETALWRVPQMVIYKTSSISYSIARHLIKVPYISLVNLVADKPVVKELIQDALTAENMDRELKKLLHDDEYAHTMRAAYEGLKNQLDCGRASDNAAKLIYKFLSDF